MSQPNNAESFVIGGFFAASFGLCLMASSPWQWLGGFSAWGVGEAVRHRRRQTYTEVWQGSANYLKDVVADVSEVASPVSSAFDNAKVQLITNAMKQLPLGERLADRYLAGQGVSTDWFDGFERRSAVVCGESKDGKTHLLLWRVQRFLESNPEGSLIIGDLDYGSSHEGTKPNNWFGLPLDNVIQTESEGITAAILGTSAEVSSRAKLTKGAIAKGNPKPAFKPLLLVVDEWVSYWSTLDDKTRETVLAAIANIMNRGIKQGNVLFLLGLHDLSVGSTGLTQAVLSQLEVILLCRASQRARNYQNLDIERRTVDDCIGKVKLIPKDRRPCIVWSEKELKVRAIPDLAIADIELVPTDEADSDQKWLDSIFTPEFELAVMKQGLNITQAWKHAGLVQKEQRKTNPRYLLFRDRFAQIQDVKLPDSGKWAVDENAPILEVTDSSDIQDSTS